MNRAHLPDDRAMLFDFKRVRPVAMWMRNTLIPLDMLFVAPDGRIVRIARETTPMTDDQIPSGEPVLAVIEIAGGRAAEIGLKRGDYVRHRIFRD